MKIYGDVRSGNCYKIKLLCHFLEIEYEWLHVDILKKETQVPFFLEKNPNAKIPVVELDDSRYLSESNAILNYLAHGTSMLPTDPYELAKVQQWQFFEQYSHEPYIAVARFIAKFLGLPQARKSEFSAKQEGGHQALKVMEQQLSETPFLVGSQITTADISLYGYTHVAHEGGFDLTAYPAIKQWLNRISATENYVAME